MDGDIPLGQIIRDKKQYQDSGQEFVDSLHKEHDEELAAASEQLVGVAAKIESELRAKHDDPKSKDADLRFSFVSGSKLDWKEVESTNGYDRLDDECRRLDVDFGVLIGKQGFTVLVSGTLPYSQKKERLIQPDRDF